MVKIGQLQHNYHICGRPHHNDDTKNSCIWTIKRYRRDNLRYGKTPWLIVHSPWRKITLPWQWHVIAHPQRCLLVIRNERQKSLQGKCFPQFKGLLKQHIKKGSVFILSSIMKMLYHQKLRKKWVHCYTIPNTANQLKQPLKKWSIQKRSHPCRMITPLRT